jgi:hypothetical protein
MGGTVVDGPPFEDVELASVGEVASIRNLSISSYIPTKLPRSILFTSPRTENCSLSIKSLHWHISQVSPGTPGLYLRDSAKTHIII